MLERPHLGADVADGARDLQLWPVRRLPIVEVLLV